MSMKPLTFSLKKNPPFKVDCRKLTPDKLKDLSIKQILEITLNNNLKLLIYLILMVKILNRLCLKTGTHNLTLSVTKCRMAASPLKAIVVIF